MPTAATDRRKYRRYDLSIEVKVQPRKRAAAAAVETYTRDISARGVYFDFSERMEIGSELELLQIKTEFIVILKKQGNMFVASNSKITMNGMCGLKAIFAPMTFLVHLTMFIGIKAGQVGAIG